MLAFGLLSARNLQAVDGLSSLGTTNLSCSVPLAWCTTCDQVDDMDIITSEELPQAVVLQLQQIDATIDLAVPSGVLNAQSQRIIQHIGFTQVCRPCLLIQMVDLFADIRPMLVGLDGDCEVLVLNYVLDTVTTTGGLDVSFASLKRDVMGGGSARLIGRDDRLLGHSDRVTVVWRRFSGRHSAKFLVL
jgi:hypothetical protein